MNRLRCFIEDFKLKQPPSQSVITLAGTGPNGAIQVPVLNELGSSYLQSVKAIHIISGGAFSFFIYVANLQGKFNKDNFQHYEEFVQKKHKLPLYQKLKHLVTMRFHENSLYPNTHIRDTFFHLFTANFGSMTLKQLDYPVTFYSYDRATNSVLALNAESHPDMPLVAVARACISVPPIHGHFDYLNYQLIDPIFSPSFQALRKKLFKTSTNHLFVNHKKTHKATNIYFLSHSDKRFPDLTLFGDFAMLYLGIPNRQITHTNQTLLEKGIINGH